MDTQRLAVAGEPCTCGRLAVIVYGTDAWGEVGWLLLNAKEPADVANALQRLGTPRHYRLDLFNHPSLRQVTGVVLRRTRKTLAAIERVWSKAQTALQTATEQAKTTDGILERAKKQSEQRPIPRANLEQLQAEHVRRVADRERLADVCRRLDAEYQQWKTIVAAQVAFYAHASCGCCWDGVREKIRT